MAISTAFSRTIGGRFFIELGKEVDVQGMGSEPGGFDALTATHYARVRFVCNDAPVEELDDDDDAIAAATQDVGA